MLQIDNFGQISMTTLARDKSAENSLIINKSQLRRHYELFLKTVDAFETMYFARG